MTRVIRFVQRQTSNVRPFFFSLHTKRERLGGACRETASVRVLQVAALLVRIVAQAVHDALQAGLDDAQQGSLGRVSVPAGLHQLPALLVKRGQTLRPRA